MFDEAYAFVAKGKTDAAIYSIMDKFDRAYSAGRFDEAKAELLGVDLSRLNESSVLTVAVVSMWARDKTGGIHRQIVAAVEKKMLETMPKKEVANCLRGLR